MKFQRTTQNMNLRILVETMRTLDGVVGTIFLPLEKKIVWRHPPGTKGASGCLTRNQDTQVHILRR